MGHGLHQGTVQGARPIRERNHRQSKAARMRCAPGRRYKDILDVTAGRLVPEWIDADVENFKGTIKNLPTREMIDVPVDEMLIVELYSK